jgi:uncharacterized membrane protein YdjX (TVP38/TMEM64 family)
MTRRRRHALALVVVGSVLGLVSVGAWIRITDSPLVHALVRLCGEPAALQTELERWGAWAPVGFILIQALQVLIAPIPGEVTGFLGGFMFVQRAGFLYSMLGLSLGSFLAFAIGRWLGAAFVEHLMRPNIWRRLSFLVETEAAALCFVLHLIPGFPKDLLCYVFGLSPMAFWVFALASTLGRMPGTWVLSAQGADTAAGKYLVAILMSGLIALVALPLHHYRHQLLAWLRHRAPGPAAVGRATEGTRP